MRPEAEAEIADANDWYEQQNAGLGDKFIGAVDVMLSALRQNPYQYQVASGQLRRAKLRGFPYGLTYRVRSGSYRCFLRSWPARPKNLAGTHLT